MNILITGGAGYVGYSVSQALAEKYPKSKIVIYDNFSKGKLENIAPLLELYSSIALVPWENADIRDYEKFEKTLIDCKPEVVIHLAAIVDAFMTNREGKDLECRIVNNVAAINIAKLCKKHGVKTFIFQSSVSIYSRGEDLKEDSPKEPISAYGISKYMAEQAILKLDDKSFNACAIRSATIVGYNPSFRYETIINLMCIRSVYGIRATVFESALKNPKSYLYLKDEAAAIIFMIMNIDKMKGESFNVSSFNADLQEVINSIEDTGVQALVRVGGEKTINQQVYTINSDKIRKLGFVTSGTLKEVVCDIIVGIKKRKETTKMLIKKNA
jgi:nucleoside-diphosphate-sugar epimerase